MSYNYFIAPNGLLYRAHKGTWEYLGKGGGWHVSHDALRGQYTALSADNARAVLAYIEHAYNNGKQSILESL